MHGKNGRKGGGIIDTLRKFRPKLVAVGVLAIFITYCGGYTFLLFSGGLSTPLQTSSPASWVFLAFIAALVVAITVLSFKAPSPSQVKKSSTWDRKIMLVFYAVFGPVILLTALARGLGKEGWTVGAALQLMLGIGFVLATSSYVRQLIEARRHRG